MAPARPGSPRGSGGGERASPGMAEALSRWRLADRPRPGGHRTGTGVGARAAYAAYAAVIAAVMASREVTA